MTDFLVHPQISTVLYLCDHGAPTLILEQLVHSPEQCPRAHVSHPAFGKVCIGRTCTGTPLLSCLPALQHVSFDGRFLHGVPAELLRQPAQTSYTRLTFL